MSPFTTSQRQKALVWLSLFHLLVITSSNYLVQLPISIFGFPYAKVSRSICTRSMLNDSFPFP